MGKFLYALWLIRTHNWIAPIDVKFGACQLWGVCLICCGVQAIFLPQILHTRSPTAAIWYRIILKINIIATKMKENG